MARCGCNQACSCRVVGIDPISVEGNGSAFNPYTVSFANDGQTGTCGIASAVGEHLGPGLQMNAPCEIVTKLSADAGNCAGFGTDGGVYVACPEACEPGTGAAVCTPCNKLKDPRFATSITADDWEASRAGFTASWDATHGHGEFGSLRMTATTPDATQGMNALNGTPVAPAAAGQTWLTSAWVYHEQPAAVLFAMAVRVGLSDGTFSNVTAPQVSVAPRVWTRVAAEATLTAANTATVGMYLTGYRGTTLTAGQWYLVDDANLSERACLDANEVDKADCAPTVASLLAGGFFTAGQYGAGANVAPYGSRASIDLAVAQDLPATRVNLNFTCDGKPVWMPYTDLADQSVYAPPGAAGTLVETLSVQTAHLIVNRASNWFGHAYEDETGLPLLADLWSAHKDRLVWFLYLSSTTARYGWTVTALRDMIVSWCMQDRVVVITQSPDRDLLAPIIAANIPVGASVNAQAITDGLTPAQLQASGMQWAQMEADVLAASVPPFVSAGLNVTRAQVVSRFESDEAQAQGMKGVLSIDPMYTARQGCDAGTDEWAYLSYMSGQVAAGTALSAQYRRDGARGMHLPAGGWIFPTNTSFVSNSVLLGWATAQNTGANYGWSGDCLPFDNGSDMGSGAFGFFFCAPTDSPATAQAPTSSTTVYQPGSDRFAVANGYAALMQANGTLQLWRIDNATATMIGSDAPFDGAVLRSRTYRLKFGVQGTSVYVRRYDTSNVLQQEILVTDSSKRGPYMHMLRYNGPTSTAWDVAYREIVTTPAAPTVLAGPQDPEGLPEPLTAGDAA